VLLHLAPGSKEDTASCREFLQDLRRRGLPDPLLIVSDGAPGLIRAIEECFPRSARQRCLAHKLRNLQSKMPEDQWPEFKARASACYHAASPVPARMLRDDLAVTYGAAVPSALACLQDDFEACIVRLRFPLAHRRSIRTTNLPERLFGEEWRPTKAILHAFGERAVLKLMYGALIRAAERMRGLRMTEFERRPLIAIRNELDRSHVEPNCSRHRIPNSFIEQDSDLTADRAQSPTHQDQELCERFHKTVLNEFTASSSAKSVLFNRRVQADLEAAAAGAYGKLPSAGVKAMRRLGSRRRHETSDICFAGNRAVDSVDFEEPGHDMYIRIALASRQRGISLTVTPHW